MAFVAALVAGGDEAVPQTAQEAAALAPPPGLLDGDLVFRRGRSLTSRIVLAQARGGARWSHVGLVLLREGQPWVLHAEPASEDSVGGVLWQRWDDFAAPGDAAAVAVARPTALDDAGRRSLRTQALAQLGKPFDDELRMSTKQRLFCTELVLDALAAAGVQPDIPLLRVPLHDEPIPSPDELGRWQGLVMMAPRPQAIPTRAGRSS